MAVVCLIVPADLAAQDRVYPEQGPLASGEIKSISPTQVVITVRSKDQTYPIHEVRKITFDNEPKELDRAREQLLLGQYEQALEEIKKITSGDIQGPKTQQDVEFYGFYSVGKLALAGQGDAKRAKNGLLNLVRKNPQTHHFFSAVELLGELSLALGEDAKPYYEKLRTAPDDATKAIGTLGLAKAALASDDVATAQRVLQELSSEQSSSPEMARLKLLAEVGLAECKLRGGNPQAAIDQLNALVEKNDSTDHELFAKINNTKGACFQALKQPQRALYSYLATDLLFFTDAESHAEALYHLSQLWPEAGEAARAAEAKKRLVQQYASSPWANK